MTIPFDPFYLVLLALAAARVTRLFTHDVITDELRLQATRWQFTDDLLSCPWCIGFWISAAAVLSFLHLSDHLAFQFVVLTFAVSQVVGLVHSFDDAIHEHDDIDVHITDEAVITSTEQER